MAADEFLKNLQLESSGHFTVSLQERWRKLGQHALGHRALWILVAIQALVLAGARAVRLSSKQGETWLVGEGSEEGYLTLDSADLLPLWETALAVLAQQQPERLVLVNWGKGCHVAVDLQGNGQPLKPTLPPPPVADQASGIYLRHPQMRVEELGSYLAFAVQYCPVPVLYYQPNLLGGNTQDLRSQYWLDQGVPADPGEDRRLRRLTFSPTTPVLADFYWEAENGPLLLKPPGGGDGALESDWTFDPHLEWHRSPQLLQSSSSTCRYIFRAPSASPQILEWSTRATILNTPLAGKAESRYQRAFVTGDCLLLLEDQDREDWLWPVRGGVLLQPIRGRLGIPGAFMVAGADPLATDLSGLELLDSQECGDWIQSLKHRARSGLETALLHPPQSRRRERHRGWKSILGSGGVAFGLSLLNGFQAYDLLFLSHGALLGGFLVYSSRELWDRHAPARWTARGRQGLVEALQHRLDRLEP